MNRSFLRHMVVAAVAILMASYWFPSAHGQDELLAKVRSYADCLIQHGQDTYGPVHSPLVAEALDRRTLRLLEGEPRERAAALTFDQWGIRTHDRMLTGANPQHCENFYQILYALSDITGEAKYREFADRSLKWFFEHCQSPETGLLAWGEHSGWDFFTEARIAYNAGNTHEFYRPWVLWDRSWQLAPGACRKFAKGLWDHQIADHATGDYSRHAGIDRHAPNRGSPYPRHGGFYMLTWAKAYERTKDPGYLKAIEVVLDGLDNDRRHGGMIISNSRKNGTHAAYDLSATISAWEAAEMVPGELAGKLRTFATANDEAFSEAAKKNDGTGRAKKKSGNLWSSGYGSSGGEIASFGNLCAIRYAQCKNDAYRARAIATADTYLKGEINLSFPVYPGTVGNVIWLLVAAHAMSGNEAYLDRADELVRQADKLFLSDGVPLPKATHVHDHYEAITGADTLMMAMLQLWAARQTPTRKLALIYSDR